MNRRELLTTTGAVASLSLCAAIVAGAPGCTPAPAAEPISADLAFAIERHRAALADMEASGRVQEACERAMQVLETPDTRSAFDAAEDAFDLDCEREQVAHNRVIAAPIATLADMRAKATYLARVARHMIHDGNTMAALLASMGAAEGVRNSAQTPEPDPLASLAAEYRDGLAAYNATGDQSSEGDEALADQLWRPAYCQLCDGPPAATTLAGALAGIRLVLWEEETCGHREDFTINTLRAALAYFDGRA